MGTFRLRVRVGNLSGRCWRSFNALVDTSYSDSSFPGHALRQLQILPMERRYKVKIAQGQLVSYNIGEVRLRLAGRERTVSVIFEKPRAKLVRGPLKLQTQPTRKRPSPGAHKGHYAG